MKKVILLLIIISLTQVHSFAQLKNYTKNGKVPIVSERTTVTVIPILQLKSESIPDRKILGGALLGPVVAGVIAAGIDLGATAIKENVKKNALSYTGQYKCAVSAEGFYNDTTVNLPSLIIKRSVIRKGHSTLEDAVIIVLHPVLSEDGTAFRYFVDDINLYEYSIAKLRNKYTYIDLNIEMKFKSLYIDKTEYKINDLRTTCIDIPMIHVGGKQLRVEKDKVYSGWIPLPLRSKVKQDGLVALSEYKETIKKTDGKVSKTIDTTITKKSDVDSYKFINSTTGLYEIEIVATETNPYKIRAENKKQIVEATADPFAAMMKAVVEAYTKKEE